MGDADQSADPRGVAKEVGGVIELTNVPKRNPFSRDSLAPWMRGNRQVQKIPLSSTVRLGSTMVRVLQRMFPGRHDELTSEAENDTPL